MSSLSLLRLATMASAAIGQVSGVSLTIGGGSLTAVGSVVAFAQATLPGSGDVTATGAVDALAQATLTAAGGVTATAADVKGQATLASVGSVSGTGSVSVLGEATSAAAGSVSGTGSVTVLAQATLAGAGSLSGTGAVTVLAQATLAGAGGVAAIAAGATGHASLAGVGDVAATGSLTAMAQSTLSGAGAVTATAAAVKGHAVVAGAGSLTAVGAVTVLGQATPAGSGAIITATGSVAALAQATLAGVGGVTATAAGVTGQSTLAGAGSLSATGAVTVTGAATLAGAGSLSATGAVGGGSGVSVVGTSTAQDTTISVPAGVAAGDTILLFQSSRSYSGLGPSDGGWTTGPTSGTLDNQTIYYRTAVGDETSFGLNGQTGDCVFLLAVMRGLGGVLDHSITAVDTHASPTFTCDDGDIVVAADLVYRNESQGAIPGTLTAIGQYGTSGEYIAAGYEEVGAGSSTAHTFDDATNGNQRVAAIRFDAVHPAATLGGVGSLTATGVSGPPAITVVGTDTEWLHTDDVVTVPAATLEGDLLLVVASSENGTIDVSEDGVVWYELYNQDMATSDYFGCWWRWATAADAGGGANVDVRINNTAVYMMVVLRNVGAPMSHSLSALGTLVSPTIAVTEGERVASVLHGFGSSDDTANVTAPVDLDEADESFSYGGEMVCFAMRTAPSTGTEPAHTWTDTNGNTNNAVSIITFDAVPTIHDPDLGAVELSTLVTPADVNLGAVELSTLVTPADVNLGAVELSVLMSS